MEWKIDEYLNEKTLFPSVNTLIKSLIIDFENNLYINSIGIAHWIEWIQSISVPSIELKNVSVAFMNQLATVDSMLNSDCRITSFKIPIYSESLQKEGAVLIQTSEDIDFDSNGNFILLKDLEMEEVNDWEVDILNEQYFDWVRNQIGS